MADYDAFFLISTDGENRVTVNTSIRITNDHLMRAYKIEGVEYVWTGTCLLGIIGKAPIKPALIAELLLGCFGTGRWLIEGDLAREVRDSVTLCAERSTRNTSTRPVLQTIGITS